MSYSVVRRRRFGLSTALPIIAVALFVAMASTESKPSTEFGLQESGAWQSGGVDPVALRQMADHGRLRALSSLPFASAPMQPVQRPDLYRLSRNDRARVAAEVGQRNGVPGHLFAALVMTESNFNPAARSHVGAIGLAQLMPATAQELGVNPHDPWQNLEGGARYLRLQYERFGDWQLALAAYNAGPTRVARLGRIPRIRETQDYVRKVLARAGHYIGTV